MSIEKLLAEREASLAVYDLYVDRRGLPYHIANATLQNSGVPYKGEEVLRHYYGNRDELIKAADEGAELFRVQKKE